MNGLSSSGLPNRKGALRLDKVGCVVLNYNTVSLTLRCVADLLAQQGVLVDCVVVDNASAPNDVEALRRELPFEVTLLQSTSNVGYARGNNIGLRWLAERGNDFLAVVNSDVRTRSVRCLAELLAALKEGGFDAVSPLCRNLPEDSGRATRLQVRRNAALVDCVVAYSPVLSRIFRLQWRRHFYLDRFDEWPDRTVAVDTINGAFFLVTAKAAQIAGIFDGGTFMGFEELIIGRQFQAGHLRAALCGRVGVDHWHGSSWQLTGLGRLTAQARAAIQAQSYYAKTYLPHGRAAAAAVLLARLFDFCAGVLYLALRSTLGLGRQVLARRR